MKKISTEELEKKLKDSNVKLIEVLDEEKYKKAHIKGAVNIPLKKIATEARDKFDENDVIVVYCSDENCEASPTAAKKLEDSGFKNVWHYEGGKKAWKEAGLPMES